jgi:DNA ligase-1
MQFKELSDYLSKLEKISSRNEITALLAELFSGLSASEIQMVCYLLTGSVASSYQGVVFNVAGKMVERAIAQTYAVDLPEVAKVAKETGDLGLTAVHFAQKNQGKNAIKVEDVFTSLTAITEAEGDGSQEQRISLIASLLKPLTGEESKYVVRMLLGNLRLGFSDKTMIDALSVMEVGSKEKSKDIARAFEVVPDIGALAKRIKESGIEKATKNITPIIGIPVMPMLCSRLKSPREMIKKMGEVSVEPKFDGLRVIIHYSKSKNILKAFTRNLKDISNMFPELSRAHSYVHASDFILDTEAVGMDPDLLTMADFQTTMKRRRKHDIAESQKSIPPASHYAASSSPPKNKSASQSSLRLKLHTPRYTIHPRDDDPPPQSKPWFPGTPSKSFSHRAA